MTVTTAKYIGVPVRNHVGLAQIGATVRVTLHSSGAVASLFDDDGVTPIANPVTTDGQGRYEFTVADGTYDLTVYTSAETYIIEGVVVSAFESSSAALDALGALTPAADKVPYFTSASAAALATFTAFGRSLVAAADAAAARTVLGLGSMALQAASAVAIIGGAIDGTTVGATTPATVKATTLQSTVATGTAPLTVASTTNVANLNASSLNGATFAAPGTIGGGTPAAATFTTLTATTVNTGLTATGVAFYGAAGVLSYDAGLTYDATNDLLIVNHNGSSLPAIPAVDDTVLQIGGKDGTTTRILIDGFGGNPTFIGRAAVGTNASKTGVVSGTVLSQFMGMGYDGTSYSTGARGGMLISGNGTWAVGDHPTKLLFSMTLAGSTTNTTYGTMTPAGFTYTATDAGTNNQINALVLQHASTGTAAAAYGLAISWQAQDDSGTMRTQARTYSNWSDPATATRSSRYIIEVVNSTTAVTACSFTPSLITQTVTDSVTAAATVAFAIQHVTSGTAAVGFGSQFQIQGHDDGGTLRVMSQMSTTWTDPVSATRSSKTNFNIVVNGSTVTALSLTPAASSITCTDAVTSTAPTMFTVTHSSSGTAANGFGLGFQLQGQDDGGTQRGMAIMAASWTTAASATRSSKITFAVQVSAVSTVGFTLASTSATFASGFPVTISDTTTSTTTAGALLIGNGTAATSVTFGGGNGNIGGNLTVGGNVTTTAGNPFVSAGRFISTGAITTADTTGRCSIWRSGGTYLGTTAGDMVFQNDLVGARSYVFTAGATTPAIVLTIGPTGNVTFIAGGNVVLDATTGSKFGTATTQKLGFWNAAPVVQPVATTAAGSAVATTASALASYGYTQAQADDIVAQLNKTTARVNDLATKLQTIGITA